MRRITADYIFPGNSKPIYHGVITIDEEGNIKDVSAERSGDEEVFAGIICPGFVNVHCHSELSYAFDKIERGKGIDFFIQQLEALKRSTSDIEKSDAAKKALLQMRNNGIVAVGDIVNTDLTVQLKEESELQFYNLIEVFGSQSKDAESIWYRALALNEKFQGKKNIIPHAPYSLSRTLFQKIRDFQKPGQTLSIHFMESEGEAEYFINGTGPMAERFKSWGLELPPHIPSAQRPMPSIGSFLAQNEKVLLIHNTFVNQEDIDFAKRNFNNTFYGLCPNANLYIEGELPPMELLLQNHLNICLGTDSLASNHSLSILEEMKTLEEHFKIGVEELILWATYNGALALGMEKQLGSIDKNKKPGLVLLENVDLNSEKSLQNARIKVL